MRIQEHPVLPGLQTPACKHKEYPDLQNELIAVDTKTQAVSSSPYMFRELVLYVSLCVFSLMRILRMSCPHKMFWWPPITADTITKRIPLTKSECHRPSFRDRLMLEAGTYAQTPRIRFHTCLASWQLVFYRHSSDDGTQTRVQQILRLALVELFQAKMHLSSCCIYSPIWQSCRHVWPLTERPQCSPVNGIQVLKSVVKCPSSQRGICPEWWKWYYNLHLNHLIVFSTLVLELLIGKLLTVYN